MKSALAAYLLAGVLGVLTGLGGAHLWFAGQQAATAAQTARNPSAPTYGDDFSPEPAAPPVPSAPPPSAPSASDAAPAAPPRRGSKLPPDHGRPTLFDF